MSNPLGHQQQANLTQQILAVDARYNAYRVPNNPQHRTLYLRRRTQLLRELSKSEDFDVTIRKDYLKARSQILHKRYGLERGRPVSRTLSAFSSSRQSMDSNMLSESLSLSPGVAIGHRRTGSGSGMAYLAPDPRPSDGVGVTPTADAQASRKMAGGTSLAENYAFAGMHSIFDQHRGAVSVVKFAHDDRTRLACSSVDGTLSVCTIIPPPGTVTHTLRGHTKAVTDFEWSQANDIIVSSSLDGTARLWQTDSGRCLRMMSLVSEVYCCRFQPSNNNMFVAGTAKCQIQVFNVSTGKAYKGSSGKVSGPVTALCFDSNGHTLWCGDAKGFIHTFVFDLTTGRMQRAKRTLVSLSNPITCISARSWMSREARDPSILVSCANAGLLLFGVMSSDGSLQLKRRFNIKHKSHNIRSAFCPLMSFRQGACVVSGSEDMCVYFFNVEDVQRPMVNKLQGHSAPVIAVDWTYDESFLASADSTGTVIVWNRQQ